MSALGKSILLVDDDQDIRELLDIYLTRAGFQVRTVGDGAGFRQALEDTPGDLLILDVMLPDEDGFSLCRWVRQHPRFATIPIIMLTASSDETDRVVGLELGADDYIGKPYSPRELLARIKAILRRAGPEPAAATRYYRFDDFRLDSVERKVVDAQGREVALTGLDFQLLKIFVEHPGKVLDRDMLCGQTRGRDAGPLDRSLDVQVSRLRQRLGDDGKQPRLIKTVRGAGYVFSAEVTAE